MKQGKVIIMLIVFSLITFRLEAQNDSNGLPEAFQSVIGNLKLTVDTTTPPEDSLTKKIRIFRVERSPICFDTVIKYQILSQQSNDKKRPKEYYVALLNECQHGTAHRLMENILINLYRQCFNEREVDELVEFYKTSVGKRMMIDIMLIIGKAGPAIQQIVKETSDKMDKEMKTGNRVK